MDLRIYPPEEMLECSIALPLSKSMSNRALIMNALTPGAGRLDDVADCDDTVSMVAALEAESKGEINVGPAGTAMRFLTAYYAATPDADVTLDGNERMRHRPIGVLVEALRQCGADIRYAGEEGYPPLRIKGKRLSGGTVEMDATVSSQYISALLMVAPTFSSPLRLELKGEIASLPYLHMTLEMMRRRGIDVERDRNVVKVECGEYKVAGIPIERDWSAASYWYEIAAISAGWVTLPGLQLPSLQGDCAIASIFEKLGVITEHDEEGNLALTPSPEVFSRIELDLADNPDVAQTLAVTCCLLGVPFRFTGLASLKIKETDRLDALRRELAKLSYDVEIERGDTLVWEMGRIPVQVVPPIDTYGDHRMAMAFAPVALFLPGLTICDAEVVSKSYPGFWRAMAQAGFTITEVEAKP